MKKRLIFFIITISLSSCITERGCEKGRKSYGEQECFFLLESKPTKKFDHYALSGKDLHTGIDTTIRLYGRWYETLGKTWDSGDTIVKKKNELFITVRKKDNSKHVSEWTCEDIFLNGISVKTGMPRPK